MHTSIRYIWKQFVISDCVLWLFCDYDNQEPDAKDNHANQRPAEAATRIFVLFLDIVRSQK